MLDLVYYLEISHKLRIILIQKCKYFGWGRFALISVLSCFSHIWLFATIWTIAHQAPLSMRFPRQEYWNGLPCPPAGESSWSRDGTLIFCIASGFFSAEPPGLSLFANPALPKYRSDVKIWTKQKCNLNGRLLVFFFFFAGWADLRI